jgi:hypothetical protein
MADTQRSLAALQTLLADNTTQQISAQDVRDFLVSALGGYGSIRVIDGATPQGVSGATPEHLGGFTADGDASGVTPDFAAGTVSPDVDGVYLAQLSASFTGNPNTTFVMGFAVDAVPTEFKAERKIASGGDIGNLATLGLLTLTAGQAVSVVVNVLVPNTDTITIKHAALLLTRMA